MFEIGELLEFLVEAKKNTYASDFSKSSIKNSDKSTTLTFEKGLWLYHDNYFGGEPFGGREVVFYDSKPVYMMVYYGFVSGDKDYVSEIYSFLRESLRMIPTDKPFRGPDKYINGEFMYKNVYSGKIDNFWGKEIIFKKGIQVYEAKYIGGFVDSVN